MFVPLVMNFVYPALGISRPISLLPLIVTVSLILGGLSVVAYRRGRFNLQVSTQKVRIAFEAVRNPWAPGLVLIPALGILGSLVMQQYFDSLVALFCLLVIAVFVILLTTSRNVAEHFYPLYVFAIALALLYGQTLTTAHLFGFDAH